MNRGPIIALAFSAVISVGIIIAATQHGSEQEDAPVAKSSAANSTSDSQGRTEETASEKTDPKKADSLQLKDGESFAMIKDSNAKESANNPQTTPVAESGKNPALGTANYTPPTSPPEDDSPLITKAPEDPPEGMVWIPGGTFQMGGQDEIHKPDEHPVHKVSLDGFYMDATEVTNAEYARFVEATGYVTYAERTHTREEYAGQVPDISMIDEKNLQPGSICFNEYCVGQGTLRVSLGFNVDSDYDLHVLTPSGDEIYYSNPSAGGGELDVDQCIDSCGTASHAENITFDGTALQGTYQVWVVNYDARSGGPFTIEVAGAVNTSFSGTLEASVVESDRFSFTY